MLIVHMQILIFRSAQRRIAVPLVSDDAVTHKSTHDGQYVIIEEELGAEDGWLEGHCQKMAMRTPIWFIAAVEIREQARPERLSASLNQERCKVASEDAKALFSDLTDLLWN